MARQMVRADRGDIEECNRVIPVKADVTAVGPMPQAISCRFRDSVSAKPQTLRIIAELGGRRRDAKSGIVEEGNLSVGLRHAAQPIEHARSRLAPLSNKRIV